MTRWFVVSKFGRQVLLRRVDFVDERFWDGVWEPTLEIVEWEFGRNDDVDEIDEPRARAAFPDVFAASVNSVN